MPVNVQEKIIAVIAERAVLAPSDVRLDQSLDDLGIDSLGMVECIFAIEEAFDISVPFNANEASSTDFDVTSVKAMISAVEGLIKDQRR